MSLSLIGAVFLIVGAICWLASPKAFVFVLSASAAFTTTAAVTVAGSSIPPFYVLAALATASSVVGFLRGVRVNHRGLPALGWFIAYAGIITFVAPTMFRGIPVLDPRGGIDGQVLAPTPLAYSAPMFAQLVYLILAAGAVLYIAQRDELRTTVLMPALFLGNALSALRLLPQLADPIDSLFRNYASALYNPYETRHFGVFAEPSFLSVFALAGLAYALYRFRLASGWERLWVLVLGASAALNLTAAVSGTAALSVLVLAAAAIVHYASRFLFARMKLHPLWLLLPVAFVLLLMVPNPITAAIWATVEDKSTSGSFLARTTSDLFSVNLGIETFGLGVGLGANRPSSFLTLVFSSVGILGTILLTVFIFRAMWPARKLKEWGPVNVTLFALLVAKIIAESALTTPIMWVALGALIFATKPRSGVSDLGDLEREPHELPARQRR